MKSLRVDEGQQTYICVHWRSFPPKGAEGDVQALRRAQVITDDEYNRILIWERECGLFEMAPSKCSTCPHQRKVVWRTTGPVLMDSKGVETPVIDAAAGEATPHNRQLAFRRPGTLGSHQAAPWVPIDKKTDGDG